MHLGQDIVVSEEEMIGIFDLDNSTGSHITRKFLSEAERAGRVRGASEGLPNSFIVCSDVRRTPLCAASMKGPGDKKAGDGLRVYLSQMSSQTLMKRVESARWEPHVSL